MEQLIRKLAKKQYNLNIFSIAKEFPSINLFRNTIDFSRIQMDYLMYLYFYDSLKSDIHLDKVTERVLNSEIYEDAYYMYKNENKKQPKSENKKHDVFLVFDNSRKK